MSTEIPFSTVAGSASTTVSAPAAATVSKFLDTSRIETFGGQNFKRWQERVFSILDLHGMAFALTEPKPDAATDQKIVEAWVHANKVCRHTIISTLSNDLFDTYCPHKEAKLIWDSMVQKYTAEDVGKQKFVVGNYYKWEMVDDKDIKIQINEYHKLLDDMKAENIELPEEFSAGILIEKLPDSWSDYKQLLKHKQKQLSLPDLITHIIIEDTNRKELKAAKAKDLTINAHMVQDKPHLNKPRYVNKNFNYVPKANNPSFKKKGNCYVCGKLGHHAHQCRKRARNDNPPKPKVNLVEGDDIIVAVISQALIVDNVKEWVVDSGATRHICANRNAFASYTVVGDGEEQIYLGDSRTVKVHGKGKVLLKLTSGKTLALNDVLHVPEIRVNLISVSLLGKVGVKVSFESDKIVMTKNNIFVENGYCSQ